MGCQLQIGCRQSFGIQPGCSLEQYQKKVNSWGLGNRKTQVQILLSPAMGLTSSKLPPPSLSFLICQMEWWYQLLQLLGNLHWDAAGIEAPAQGFPCEWAITVGYYHYCCVAGMHFFHILIIQTLGCNLQSLCKFTMVKFVLSPLLPLQSCFK